MISGIYKIENLKNHKCYYGSSKDVYNRFIQHKSRLNNKTHPNIILQRAWNKYGQNNFIFEIVEKCDISNLLIVEQKYLDLNNAYNIAKNALGGDNLTNNPNRLDIIKRITKSIHMRLDKMTTTEKKKKFAKYLHDNPNWKGGITKQTVCKCGNIKKYTSKECKKCELKKRKGKNNNFYGKTHTKETKEKISKSNIGNKPKNSKIVIINNIKYNSICEASRILNIPSPTIHYRINSKNKKFNKYDYL